MTMYVGGESMDCPVPEWRPIPCQILTECIETKCTELSLGDMISLDQPITGTIPSSIWSMMPQLEVVTLGNNMFT